MGGSKLAQMLLKGDQTPKISRETLSTYITKKKTANTVIFVALLAMAWGPHTFEMATLLPVKFRRRCSLEKSFIAIFST